ncbi:MAG: signal recognition particle protein [Pseudomonadota bacterium]
MLEHLSDRLSHVMKKLRGEAVLTEENMQLALREVRVALLEADVALPVIKAFLDDVKVEALGQEVKGSLNPGQAFVGVVHRSLVRLMGEPEDLNLRHEPPVVILMAGLQGAGKTTTVGKLALWLKEQKKKIMVTSCDVYRPAAIDQLARLAEQTGVILFPSTTDQLPVDIAKEAYLQARKQHVDVLIVDTAGRLAIDEAMMAEIRALHTTLSPQETLLVVDAMQGQDAVNTAKAFHDSLNLTGVVLTKMDGDSRGGAALSVKHVTGVPIKFCGTSEKIDGFERFHADRLASRIVGMGDVLSLIEQVERHTDQAAAEKLAKKVKSGGDFDFNDFLAQLEQMKRMGGIKSLIDKLPSEFSKMAQEQPGGGADEKVLHRIEGIIHSMTPKERANPDLIKASRKRRIALGAGVSVQEINRVINQFEQTRKMMKMFSQGGLVKKMMGGMKSWFPKG